MESMFNSMFQNVQNDNQLSEEQKKLISSKEEQLMVADKALAKGMKTLADKYSEESQKPDLIREQGNLAADHAAFRAKTVAEIRAIQPSWAETVSERTKAVLDAADTVTTRGIGTMGKAAGAAIAPVAKQAGNFLGKLYKASRDSFIEGTASK